MTTQDPQLPGPTEDDSARAVTVLPAECYPRVLAFLQNQWFRNPDRVKAILEHGERLYPGRYRRRFIASMLFASGNRTGNILRRTFGNEWLEGIEWEEASTAIGGNAASVFPADLAHMAGVIDKVRPLVVIGFGKIACDALHKWAGVPWLLIEAPHPCARGTDTLEKLDLARQALEDFALTLPDKMPDSGDVIHTEIGAFCRKCWGRGRSLWPSACFCTGDVN